ncbi:hypothetical protein SCHPADRAFT_885541 [Schizopora paradoxa]|uniref:Protein-S-isoprenylcysteine O-methyltransferase n=1 Tax=Schizopora paradoxa TaxID=27342 RepID=A0A0H2S5B7_9AGAM|nr:hypothetical protein SCHPADRAFT_885541 [Schizopora paradoxa]
MVSGQLSGSLCRGLLLASAALAHHISSTPPNLADKTSARLLSGQEEKASDARNSCPDQIHGPRLLNQIGMALVRISPYTVWFFTALELIVRIASAFPSSPAASAVVRMFNASAPATTVLASPVTTVYFAAFVAVYIGYRIRTSCFATLGRHFTFTHTTLSEHQLVKDGPYSIVRHASYSGEVLVRGGTILMLLAPGGWAYEFGVIGSRYANTLSKTVVDAAFGSPFARLAGWVLVFHVCWATFNTSFLIWRSSIEDATLKEKFGAEWEAYRKQVPCKFIPYIV